MEHCSTEKIKNPNWATLILNLRQMLWHSAQRNASGDLELFERYFSRSNWNRAKNDFARINVFFADSNIVVTEEVPDYELPQLISDIGGQLGVWIGMSVVTMSESLVLIFRLLRCLCSSLTPGRHEVVVWSQRSLSDAIRVYVTIICTTLLLILLSLWIETKYENV